MLRDYMAANELHRVASLSAFNVEGAKSKKRVNQHLTSYEFPDGSRLFIHTTKQLASACFPGWKGRADDLHLGPVHGVSLKINRSN